MAWSLAATSVIAALFGLVLANAAAAEPDSWDPARVIDEGRGGVDSPAMAVDADGNAVAAWFSNAQGDEAVAARASVAGQGWGPVTVLSAPGAQYARTPRAVFVSPGHAIVGWMEFNGTNWSSFVAEYTLAGGWSAATPIEDLSLDCYAPVLAADEGGNLTAAFQCYEGSYNPRMWAVRRPAGGVWGTPVLLRNDTGAVAPDVAARGGRAVVVWMEPNVFAAEYDPAGGWTAATPLGAGGAQVVHVDADSEGNWFAVWNQYLAPSYSIFASQKGVGGAWTAPVDIDGQGTNTTWAPSIAVAPNGTAVVAFRTERNFGELWTVAFLPGSGWQEPSLIFFEPPWGAGWPTVAVAGDGTFVATWDGYRSDSQYSWYSAWSARLDPLTGWSAPVRLDDRDSFDEGVLSDVAAAGGHAWVAWMHYDGDRQYIYAAHYSVPDHTAPALDVASPVDGASTATSAVRVEGTTEPGASVTANGVGGVVGPDGSFSFLLAVAPGANVVGVTATDPSGNAATVSVTVTYSDPAPGLQEDLADAQDDLAGALADLTAVRADANATEADLAAAQAALTAAQAQVALLGTRLAAAEANATALRADVVAAQGDLDDAQLGLEKTSSDLTGAKADVVSLTGQVSALSAVSLAGLGAALAAIGLAVVMARRSGAPKREPPAEIPKGGS